MFCKYCGNNIDDDSAFCRFCGKNLGNSAPVQNISYQSAPQQYTAYQNVPQQNVSQQQFPDQYIQSQNSVYALILERKFDFQALSMAVHVILDGEEIAVLGSKGGSLAVPINPGAHEICAIVTKGKKTVSALDKAPIYVNNHNIVVQFSIKRTAWNAYWQMEAVEDINDATVNIPTQY